MPVAIQAPFDLSGHIALVTGANHGIGAASARLLARCGANVLLTFLRLYDDGDAGIPEGYRWARRSTAESVLAEIRSDGGKALALEADLSDPGVARQLFDTAESQFGPVDILINNASGWIADTFKPELLDRLGRSLQPLTASTFDRVFTVDARGAALLIAEFARRHVDRGATWGRIVGLTSGGLEGFPEEVSYGASKAAQVSLTMSAASEPGPMASRRTWSIPL